MYHTLPVYWSNCNLTVMKLSDPADSHHHGHHKISKPIRRHLGKINQVLGSHCVVRPLVRPYN
jgi:hypothetical protein